MTLLSSFWKGLQHFFYHKERVRPLCLKSHSTFSWSTKELTYLWEGRRYNKLYPAITIFWEETRLEFWAIWAFFTTKKRGGNNSLKSGPYKALIYYGGFPLPFFLRGLHVCDKLIARSFGGEETRRVINNPQRKRECYASTSSLFGRRNTRRSVGRSLTHPGRAFLQQRHTPSVCVQPAVIK